MSDQTENQETGSDLDVLKAVAKELNIKHHPSIGLVKLQKMVDAYHASPKQVNKPVMEQLTVTEITELQQLRAEKAERDEKAKAAAKPKLSKGAARKAAMDEAKKLIRIRVANMNPNKRDWEGEMYTVSNAVVGTHKKYVPFNNDEGWHVQNIIVKHMQERKCQIFFTKKDARGNKTRHGKLINELNVEIMDPLTVPELKELAQRQAMARGE